MARNTIIVGLILILMGVVIFGITQAKTSLIPAIFGLPILICGVMALKQSWRKHAMHVAMVFGLLGALMPGGMVVMALIKGQIERPTAFVMQLMMALVCLAFVIMGVMSFIAARKNRETAQATK